MDARNSNQKGNIAEAMITAKAVQLGVCVLRPQTEHERYDLAFDVAGAIYRVQCKWARLQGAVVQIGLASYRWTPRGSVRSTYSVDEIDFVAAYCEALDTCYLMPADGIAGRRAIQLRLTPPRNGQRAGLNLASGFELPGAVAQLGERLRGTQEAVGSSPISSTPSAKPVESVGAHEFRNRFGWYMERAAAGEHVHVSRHGRPFVRLLPAQESRPPAQPERMASTGSTGSTDLRAV